MPFFERTASSRAALALALAFVLGVAGGAYAQGTQTSTLSGNVSSTDGQPLPGVTVSVASRSLQGERTAVSDANGSYIFKFLPSGDYTVTFALTGFTTIEQKRSIALGEQIRINQTLQVASVEEVITVTASAPSALETSEVKVNYTNEQIDSLATSRTLSGIAELAPGLTDNTPNAGQVTIAGAFAYDNVFLIDGVDTNDNLFGTSNNLFIEDAIEEVQVLTSGISAEYGRFSGGVINAVTKRGGNEFHGSFRLDFERPSWRDETPFEEDRGIERDDTFSKYYQGTLGGPIVKDRLWFFGATRIQRETLSNTFNQTGIAYQQENNNDRFEVKLTGSINPNHTLQASLIDNDTAQNSRPSFSFSIDPAVLQDRTLPNRLWVANYSGVLSSNLFAELQYSEKRFGFRRTDGSTDIFDSPMITNNLALAHFNAPYFDFTDPEDRNNQQIHGSLSYFLSTADLGNHDIKGGVEYFRSRRVGGNSQSATGFVFDVDYKTDASGAPILDSNGRLIPLWVPGDTFIENWLAVRGAQIDLKTTSVYVNDRWSLNEHWSFNLGVRYEKVRGDATGNITTVDTDTIVPRLAASFDPTGDGKWRFDATYAHYAGKYSEAQFAENTNVGTPDLLFGIYTGPAGEGLGFAPGFDPSNYSTILGQFPTANIFVESGLHSPVTREWTLQAGTRLGDNGFLKAIYTNRDVSGFVEDFTTVADGFTDVVVDGTNFGTFDNVVYRNSDDLERKYQGLQFLTNYRFSDRLHFNAHYTLQLKNEGNFEGEATNQPGISTAFGEYPEIRDAQRHYPTGRLDDYQRHKIRAFMTYDLGLGAFGTLRPGLLYRYNSATTYSLSAFQNLSSNQRGILAGLPYVSPPTRTTTFFGDRGVGEFDDFHVFDLAFTYDIKTYKTVKPYVKFEIRNVFNNKKLIEWNTTVTADPSSAVDALGLRTGFREGASFGQGTSTTHYVIPREFFLAVGFRF